jgi:eukaryotic-like serine/threonine-protein kinase
VASAFRRARREGQTTVPLEAGTRLGPYEIQSAIGAGGMGEVYKGRDTRLDRAVAIKILPAALAADAQFRERFEREARAISQLTHPNICTLYDVGEQTPSPQPSGTGHDSVRFLVMELLDGETLESRLARGGPERAALQVNDALAIAIQIADALAVAHRAGIVHRDLKPGNIFLVRSGGASTPPIAKLLDFGLAKTSAPAVSGSATMAPTTPASVTAQGTILGTFQYMAPEQIEGMEADARTDLFAFGCVLYEMLTGQKAFEGKTRASLLGAILKDEPAPVSKVRPIAPASLDRIVATCLAKDPEDRWQTARDLQRELKWVASAGSGPAEVGHHESQGTWRPPSGGPAGRVMPLIATALASAIVVGLAAWALTRPAPGSRPIVRLQATPAATAPLLIDTLSTDVAFSPDGTRIVYTGGTGVSQLYFRQLDQTEPTPIRGATNLRGPFFSPDGEWIGYFEGNALKKVSVRGGPSVVLCTECAQGNRGATWGGKDTIVFSVLGGTQGLRRISAAGGDAAALTAVDRQAGDQAHLWPYFLPGGDAILFTISGTGGMESSLIAVRDLKAGTQKVLIRGGSQPHYVATGHLVYAVAGTLRAVAFDLASLSVMGNPVPVVERIVTKSSGSADFSVSQDGSLAYISGDPLTSGQRLAWIDRQGHEEPIAAPLRGYLYLRLSPDGQRVALDIRDRQQDIWIWDFSRSLMTRLTTDPNLDQSPVWTRDGRRVLFASSRDGSPNIYWQAADGTGAAERLTTSPQIQVPWTVTPDGKSLVLRDTDPKGTSHVSIMPLEGERAVKPLLLSAFNESHAEISPDGRWIVYQSDESGRNEIHVRPFPAVQAGHWQISTDGGTRPLWARSGRELFFVDLSSRLMAVPVQAGSSFGVGNPTAIGTIEGSVAGALGRNYDASLDGKRFLVIRSAAQTGQVTPPQLNLVLNWGEELKRLVPVKK